VTNNWKKAGGFYLTMDRDGRVSLWDSREITLEIFGETPIFLKLTDLQLQQLENAAKETSQEGNGV